MGSPQRRPPAKKKGRITPTQRGVLVAQRTRAAGVLDWLESRRERAEVAQEHAVKVAREQRAADRQARGYDRDAEQAREPEWVYEHVDRPMRPYRNPGKDRSLPGKARRRARLNRTT